MCILLLYLKSPAGVVVPIPTLPVELTRRESTAAAPEVR